MSRISRRQQRDERFKAQGVGVGACCCRSQMLVQPL